MADWRVAKRTQQATFPHGCPQGSLRYYSGHPRKEPYYGSCQEDHEEDRPQEVDQEAGHQEGREEVDQEDWRQEVVGWLLAR
jgi:hypothetical protein